MVGGRFPLPPAVRSGSLWCMNEPTPPEERKASTIRFTTETLRRIHHYRSVFGMTFGAAVNALVIQGLRLHDEEAQIRAALRTAAIRKNPSGGHS